MSIEGHRHTSGLRPQRRGVASYVVGMTGVGVGVAIAIGATVGGGCSRAPTAEQRQAASDQAAMARQVAFDRDMMARLARLDGVALVVPSATDAHELDVTLTAASTVKPGEGIVLTVSLVNLWLTTEGLEDDVREAQIAYFMTAAADAIRQASEPDILEPTRILPVIKSKEWLQDDRLADAPVGKQTLSQPLVGDLFVTWAMDGETSMRYLNDGDLATLNLDRPGLDALASANFASYATDYALTRIDSIWLVELDGTYEGSLLLNPALWQVLGTKVSGNPVVCHPARGALAVTGSDDAAGLKALRRWAAGMVDAPYPQTDALLEYRDHTWVLFDALAATPAVPAAPVAPPPAPEAVDAPPQP